MISMNIEWGGGEGWIGRKEERGKKRGRGGGPDLIGIGVSDHSFGKGLECFVNLYPDTDCPETRFSISG